MWASPPTLPYPSTVITHDVRDNLTRTVTQHITAAATLGSGGWTSFRCRQVRGNIKSVSMRSSFFQCHLNPRGDSTCHTDNTLTVSRNALNHPIVRYGGPRICLPIPSHYAWRATTQCLQPRVQPGSVLESSFDVALPNPIPVCFFFPKFFFLLYLSFDLM